MNLTKFLTDGAPIQAKSANIGLAVLRLFSGLALAFGHGIGKVPPSARFIEGVGKLGFPAPEFFAWSAGLSEFAGGLLLAAGLFTRPSAFSILVTMGVAGLIRHSADPFALKEKALLYAFIALLFLLVGAGKYGLDTLFRQKADSA